MSFEWRYLANITGPAGDTVANERLAEIDRALADTAKRGLQPTPNGDEVIQFSDKDGYLAGWFNKEGRFALPKAPILPMDSIPTEALAGFTPMDPSTGYLVGFADKSGYLAAGLTVEGSWRVFKGDGGEASRTKIACFGDSLTRGYSGTTAWDVADSWPAKLGSKIPGAEVVNLGFSGNTTDEIRFRTGVLEARFSPVGGSIPGTGSVAVTTKQTLGFATNREFTIGGYLGGIYGMLRHEGGAYTFTRTSPGVGVQVATPLTFKVDQPDYGSHTAIFWVGRNDVSFGITGPEATVADHVVTATLEMVEWLRHRVKHVIVVGPTNRVDEPKGSAGYDTVLEVNQRLQALLPGKYMNVRKWLVEKAIYEAGVTPTAADLAQIEKDAPPLSIMDGGTHFNRPIAPLLADKFYARLASKGFI